MYSMYLQISAYIAFEKNCCRLNTVQLLLRVGILNIPPNSSWVICRNMELGVFSGQ